ncbi:MAG: ATP-binding cassette domain-containing protein, partial [Lachnospiraceae bacterium]|nr:ATP-binding cassette domain-containing protein [Lachnospiraceae bacterium]
MIELQNISKFYYTDTSVTLALNKISVKFPDTGFVAITGESGSGKSTLLNIISGLDTFDDGEMYFKGNPTFQYDSKDWEEYRRNEIGFVFQNYGLIEHYSVLDNCKAALLIRGFSDLKATRVAKSFIDKVGLSE